MNIRSFAALAAYSFLLGCSDAPVAPNCPSLLAGWTQPKDGMEPHGWHATVTLNGKKVLWDGEAVDDTEFRQRLRQSTNLSPVLHILFDPAKGRSCKEAEEIRDEIDRLADCQGGGLCGQGNPEEFKRLRDSGAVWRAKQGENSHRR